jgi:hypothetical protein
MPIKLEVMANGGVRMLHDDAVDLKQFGDVEVVRASHVEYDNEKKGWYVQSAKTLKMLKEGIASRADALAWEKVYYSPGGEGWNELTEENI